MKHAIMIVMITKPTINSGDIESWGGSMIVDLYFLDLCSSPNFKGTTKPM